MVGQYGNLDSKDIVADFFPIFESNYAGSWARALAWANPDAVHETETYRWLGGTPGMRQWIDGRQEQGFGKYQYQLPNVKYETTVPIYLDDLRRDKTGQIRIRVEDTAEEAGRHDEELVTTLITANGNGYDGVAFFGTTHPEDPAGNQKNALSATEVPAADVAAATAPTGAEMAQVLLQTVGYMYGYKNDKGKAVNGTARMFTVMVGTAPLYGAAVQAVNLNNLANGTVANNPLLAIPEVKFQVVYNPALSARTTKVNVFRTDAKLKPFITQYETQLETQLLGPGSDEEFKNDRHVFGLKWVKAAGYGLWQHATEVTLS